MSALALAIRYARRELRSGLSGFRIFLAALTLGVAAIAGVGSLGQAFLTGLSEKGQMLLGGDVRMARQYVPADEKERAFMEGFGRVTGMASMRSMATDVSNPERRALIEIKAVDPLYPLVGQMVLDPLIPLGAALDCSKTCGAVVEDTLLVRLGLKPGDLIRIGNADFEVRARIVSEPDRVVGGFTLGPRVMLSREGLTRSGLIVEGSLISYTYKIVFAGATTPEEFRAAEEAKFPDARWEVNDRTNAIPRVTRFVEQATMFLSLIALTALIVGAVGAGQAVEAFLERRRETIATLKAMGAEGRDIFLIYLVQIMAVACVGLVLGLMIGAALPFAVEYFFGAAIPAPANYAVYPGPLVLAATFGLLAALGFAIPPLARAREIAPAGLFRDLVAPAHARARLAYRLAGLAIFIAIAVLSIVLSPYPEFNLGFLVGMAVVLLFLRFAGALIRKLIASLPRQRSQVVRLALANLIRPGAPSTSIMVALGLGLTLLATVALLDASVHAEVEDQLPERAPSFFFADIQKEQVEPFKAEIERFKSVSDFTATPMLRGRIVKLNGVPAEEAKIAADAQWAINGDRGVTYASVPPENTRVVEGPEWWPADYRGPPLLSFDAGLARGMGLRIGDTITLNILGRDIDATIFNLRRIDFRTGGVNFINIMSPGTIDQAPHSFLATVRAAANDEEAMFAAVSRAFPNVTIVRVKEALAQAGELLAMLARGVSIASLITILAGVLVLAGAIAAGHRARLYDAVVLKVLGATRARLGAVYVIEYGLLGMLAGVAALGAGTVAAWAVAYLVLDIPFVFAAKAVALTIVGGALGTLVLGLAGGFAALSAKPASRLRNP